MASATASPTSGFSASATSEAVMETSDTTGCPV